MPSVIQDQRQIVFPVEDPNHLFNNSEKEQRQKHDKIDGLRGDDRLSDGLGGDDWLFDGLLLGWIDGVLISWWAIFVRKLVIKFWFVVVVRFLDLGGLALFP